MSIKITTEIRDFCRKYKEYTSGVLTKFVKGSKLRFRVNVKDDSLSLIFPSQSRGNLFELDDEDLKILYDKYSKLVLHERNDNIDEVKNEYKNDI